MNRSSERFSNIAGRGIKRRRRADRSGAISAGAEVSEIYNLIQAAKRVPKFQIPKYAYKRDASRGELYEHDI